MKNKVIIITGASRGIGKAIVEMLKPKNATLVLVARDENKMKEVIAGYEGDYLIKKTDISDEQSVKNLIEEVIAKYGRIDVLINNAGFVDPKSVFETTLENWEKTIRVNLTGAFLCTREAGKYMKKTGGKIIYVASTAGLTARPGWSAYAASKAGLINFAITMAEELRQYNIKVFTIAPGRTATNLRRRLAPNEDPRTIMQPEKVAQIVEFLLSDAADVIEGQTILVRERK